MSRYRDDEDCQQQQQEEGSDESNHAAKRQRVGGGEEVAQYLHIASTLDCRSDTSSPCGRLRASLSCAGEC